MTNSTIAATLTAYGFETRAHELFWGIGSLVWGHTAHVQACGTDLYKVTIAHWYYDQYGDPVQDTQETRVLYGGQALAWIFEEMPSSFWRKR